MAVTTTTTRTRLALVSLVVGAFVAAGCADESTPAGVAAPLETAPLGVLPDAPTPLEPPPPPSTAPTTTGFVEAEIEPIDGPIGEVVDGNRVLLIGDTSMATLTERQGGIACPVLPDIGWQVRIEAEVGRFVSFAPEVVDRLIVDSGEEWDAVGLMFGLHVEGQPEEFATVLADVIERLDGRPVIVYTVAERSDPDDQPDETAVEINRQIRLLAARHPNVVLIDWADSVDSEETLVLVDDDRVPTTEGMGRLVLLTAYTLGHFPPEPAVDVPSSSVPPDSSSVTSTTSTTTTTTTEPLVTVPPVEGACLPALYTDDSAILI